MKELQSLQGVLTRKPRHKPQVSESLPDNMKRIYFDNAATTAIDKRVAKAMREFELDFYGNPSSTHREGQNARAKIDFARDVVAKFLSAKPEEIIFTSGATEANNLAVRGVVDHAITKLKIKKPHVVTTMLEHQSVYNTVKDLESRGIITASYLKPEKNGLISITQAVEALRKDTVLVSIIFVSNEIGSVLPIREIGQALQNLTTHNSPLKPIFHVDAVQAAKYFNLNVEKLNCDLLTLSAHKIFGPKGIGALYVKSKTPIKAIQSGGSQEYGLRAGTQNTPGIIGFAKAIELLGSLEQRQKNAAKISKLRDKLISLVLNNKDVVLNGPTGDRRVPDNVSFTIYGIDQDSLMTALDLAGIAASTGSACVSGSSRPSHVIESLGVVNDKDAALARFTLNVYNTLSEINSVANNLHLIIKKLRI